LQLVAERKSLLSQVQPEILPVSSSVTGMLLIFGVLKAADEILALNEHVAHRAIVLIAHARAALIVQQVKRRDVLAFRRGMDADGDRH
jgi:hypothetical protein